MAWTSELNLTIIVGVCFI